MTLKFKSSRGSDNPLDGCIGALNGIPSKIRKPHKLNDPAFYYCWKQFYAISVQAMVDADYRFRCLSAVCIGATHDFLSHAVSNLGKYLKEDKLKGPFWIAADEAYICTEFLLTPFSKIQLDRSVLSKYENSYNFFHSSHRIHVEQAFGVLFTRFGIMWRPLRFSLRTNTSAVLGAMILHNFCIDNSDAMDSMPESEKKRNKRAFKRWYNRCRSQLAEQHQAVVSVEIAEIDPAMSKSRARREMGERLKYLRKPKPYSQHRFDDEPEDNNEEHRNQLIKKNGGKPGLSSQWKTSMCIAALSLVSSA